MDFKKILNTLDSMEARIITPAAPTLPKSVQLNEDAQLRVLAGQTTVLAESELMEKAVSKAQQKAAGAALAAKRGEGTAKGASKEMAKMDTKELKKVAGTKHKGLPEKKTDESIKEAAIDDLLDKQKTDKNKDNSGSRKVAGTRYGGSAQKDDDTTDKSDAKKGRKTAKESVELDVEEFNDTFSQMVEAAKKGAKPDFLDIDKDGDKKEPMKKAVADKKKGSAPKKGVNPFAKKEVKEAEDRPAAKKSEREVTLPSGAKVKATKVQGHQSQKGDKAADKEKNESKMMPTGKKRPVKESIESKMLFKQMIQLVQESGGQQQIDPTDAALFSWAQRVAKSKLGEGMKAEVYAGLVYERMGGRFEMYDVLSENKK
jgi:hypothetical protein